MVKFFDLLIFILIGFGFGFFWVWVTRPLERRGWGHINKLHIHHTVLGLLLMAIGVFNNDIKFAGFGFEMIVHHFVTEGPQFITKD